MFSRIAALKLTLCRTLLIAALPMACAVGVTQEDTGDMSDPVTGGSSGGGKPGASGSAAVLPKAGSAGSAGSAVANPFGGSASSGGNAGSSSSGGQSTAGAGGSGGKAGSGSGGTGGAAGSASGGSGTGGSGTGGSGTGTCACPKKLTWTDNTVLNWAKGDCLDVGGKVYLYTGTIPQTYANGQCNPTKQEAWCTDSGNDYKFMLCM